MSWTPNSGFKTLTSWLTLGLDENRITASVSMQSRCLFRSFTCTCIRVTRCLCNVAIHARTNSIHFNSMLQYEFPPSPWQKKYTWPKFGDSCMHVYPPNNFCVYNKKINRYSVNLPTNKQWGSLLINISTSIQKPRRPGLKATLSCSEHLRTKESINY